MAVGAIALSVPLGQLVKTNIKKRFFSGRTTKRGGGVNPETWTTKEKRKKRNKSLIKKYHKNHKNTRKINTKICLLMLCSVLDDVIDQPKNVMNSFISIWKYRFSNLILTTIFLIHFLSILDHFQAIIIIVKKWYWSWTTIL